MHIIMPLSVLVVGFLFLWKGGDYLTNAAAHLSAKLKLPQFIIGVTLVAFGTSLPELFVNITALSQGNSTLIFGNIIGSNISNMFLILGTATILCSIVVSKHLLYKELTLNVLASFVLLLTLYPGMRLLSENPHLSRFNGIILLALFILSFKVIIQFSSKEVEDISKEATVKESYARTSLHFIGGLTALLLGSRFVVDSAQILAKTIGISDAFIALFMIALGTSLPELVTAVIAARKQQSGLVLGNIIGSNIFNIFLILGICATITPIHFAPILLMDLYIMIVSGIVCIGLCLIPKQNVISRYKGVILLLSYISYISVIFLRG